jgi:hypothetical protein
MTVLIATGFPNGVVIAADSYRMERCGNEDWNVQKVWEGRTKDGIPLVFGWSGNTGIITFLETFSLAESTRLALAEIETAQYPSSQEFLKYFFYVVATRITHFLDLRDPDGACFPTDPPTEVARCLVGFFWDDGPYVGFVMLKREKSGVVADLQAFRQDDSERVIASGCTALDDALDPSYREIEEAVKDAEQFVQKCIDHRDILPECKVYGGKVQAGMITRDGFAWAIVPSAGKAASLVPSQGSPRHGNDRLSSEEPVRACTGMLSTERKQ